VAACLLAALLTTGSVRRAAHWKAVASAADQAAADTQRAHLPVGLTPEALPGQIVEYQAAAQATSKIPPPTDAASLMAQLLAVWPTDVPCTPQSIVIGDAGVSVSVLIEGDPALFLRRFAPPQRWSMHEPKMNTSGAFTRIALALIPPSSHAHSGKGARP
jgi:hypothetical protein